MTYKALIRLILNLKLLRNNLFACFEFYHVWEKMPTSMYTNLIIHTINSLKIRRKIQFWEDAQLLFRFAQFFTLPPPRLNPVYALLNVVNTIFLFLAPDQGEQYL